MEFLLSFAAIVAIVFGVYYFSNKILEHFGTKKLANMLRGNLREDFLRQHPECLLKDKTICTCGSKRTLITRAIGWGSTAQVVREHFCGQCGKRCYFSVSGSHLEKIVDALKREKREMV